MELSKMDQRHSKLLELIKKKGRVSIQEIINQFECSVATARRDLEMLEKSGRVIRTIGGAIYEGGSGSEISFSEKKLVYWKEKELIASVAADLVTEGDVVGLTGGTTTYLIAKELKSRRNITVVTNAVNIASELAESADIQVVMTGGVMRSKSYELCGPLAEKVIENLNVTKMFFGVDGVSEELGFNMYSELENRIVQLFIARSRKVFAVFDHSKIGRSSLLTIAPFQQVSGIVTDRLPDQVFIEACKKAGLEIHIPPLTRFDDSL
jgi:DeoR/GlpR family transcriptional regulator of sugar metabolism